MESRKDAAVECFRSGFNCAQAVFSTYAEDFGINKTEALRISCGFGGGMGRLQETCGAVTGAIMLIGCKHGKTKKEDTESTETTYKLVQEFWDEFIAKHGALTCKELLGCNIRTPEGHQYMKDHNFRELKCACYVHDASEIVEKMLISGK
jgi:C_GCAxxG_C_C family probable redox protein